MSKLITLGCSLTHQEGLKERLSSLTDLELLNVSESAGSNGLQIYRLEKLIIDQIIDPDDIIIWQITSDTRVPCRIMLSDALEKQEIIDIQSELDKSDEYHYVMSETNLFDDHQRVDLLCNSPLVGKRTLDHDVNQWNQSLLATMIMLRKMDVRLLVFLGWQDVFEDSVRETFLAMLESNDILHVKIPYVEYVRNNGNGFRDDGQHPSEESAAEFAEKIIFPKLQEAGWA